MKVYELLEEVKPKAAKPKIWTRTKKEVRQVADKLTGKLNKAVKNAGMMHDDGPLPRIMFHVYPSADNKKLQVSVVNFLAHKPYDVTKLGGFWKEHVAPLSGAPQEPPSKLPFKFEIPVSRISEFERVKNKKDSDESIARAKASGIHGAQMIDTIKSLLGISYHEINE